MSANFLKIFLEGLNEIVISGFLLFSFSLKSGVDFTSAIMLSCNPRSRSEVIMATYHTGTPGCGYASIVPYSKTLSLLHIHPTQ